ncbi:feruloyl-CoA synthase [Gymnodinialimonas ceratoperidinii]|uniref:feruloyl-CoA synthase n=1 Tax=Gymnodinialimonas ceratoperidinii TaxID=2856823 RepID=UPI001FFD5EF6|nr:feruloyl-CoA synthase [Gymnodinialimonas ceratoperidinii]
MNKYQPHDVIREDRPDGSILLRARAELGPVVERTTDWLEHWAEATPDAVFLAERAGDGWREVSYREARDTARAMAVGLRDISVGPGRPVMVVTGNSVAHGLLTLACHYAAAPIVPVAEQYAAIPAARGQIDYIASLVKPGAVFAEDGVALAEIFERDSLRDARPLMVHGPGLTLDDLTRMGGDLRGVEVGPDTVAKILMTSGSTSAPKGVRTTHRMMCTNQVQIAAALPFLRERPPVLVDWLPWNHVFGGSHNFNLVLANGGALYIDGGKPVPALIGKTIENNRLKQGTISFNVPVGFAALRDAMKDDPAFAQAFFEDLDMLFYAGASLPQDVWADLETMARDVRGELPLFTSSWGLTETAPAALLQHEPTERSGVVGVPLPGVDVKLLPVEDRFEVRVKGPSIFEGYLGDPEKTAEAFDEEGFFKTGDAMAFVDPANMNQGLRFDGRIGEDFKLMTGTWVRAGTLRLKVLEALKGIAQDVVLVGEGKGEVGALVVPTQACRDTAEEADGALITDKSFDGLCGWSGGSAGQIKRVLVMAEPPSMAEGEITAKGNLNFAKIKARRADLVERLYAGGPGVIMVGDS